MASGLGLLKIDQFNPSDEKWDSYQERLEQHFIVNDVETDKKKVAMLVSVIGPKAYGLLKDLVSPKLPAELKYDELTGKLKSHFNPEAPVMAERYKFYARKQQSSESVSEYLAALKKMTRTCKFGAFLNEALRDIFICGLKEEFIQRKLFAEDERLTLEKAVSVALSMETASKQTAMVRERESRGKFLESRNGEPTQVLLLWKTRTHEAGL